MLSLNFTPFPILQSDRVLLRRIRKADAAPLYFLRSDERVMQYIDRERAGSVQDAEKYIGVIDDALDKETAITWGIALRHEPNELIGTVGFWRVDREHHRGEIGYMLHYEHWQKGLMFEILNTVIPYGFGVMGLHSIEANVNTGNEASVALLKKCGFEQSAYYREDYYFRGKFLDSLVFSLLEPQYKKALQLIAR